MEGEEHPLDRAGVKKAWKKKKKHLFQIPSRVIRTSSLKRDRIDLLDRVEWRGISSTSRSSGIKIFGPKSFENWARIDAVARARFQQDRLERTNETTLSTGNERAMFVGTLTRAFRCSLEHLGVAASRRGGRRHRGRRGCAQRRDCPRLAKSEDARAVLRGPGLPGPFPVQLRELAPLQYQLIKSVQTLVKPLAGDRARRLHSDARASRHPRQFQHAQVLFQFAHLFGTCGHREEPVQTLTFQKGEST